MSHLQNSSTPPTSTRGRGLGTVIGCFVAAIAISSLFGVMDTPRPPHVTVAWADDTPKPPQGVRTYEINKGFIVFVPTDEAARIEMSNEMRARATIKTEDFSTTITVDDVPITDSEIRIYVPRAASCTFDTMSGFVRSEGLPCDENVFTLRSGKMAIEDVPTEHGSLRGKVGVGAVSIKDNSGPAKRSAGVGDLRVEIPGTLTGPSLRARVDVGQLTIDVDEQ